MKKQYLAIVRTNLDDLPLYVGTRAGAMKAIRELTIERIDELFRLMDTATGAGLVCCSIVTFEDGLPVAQEQVTTPVSGAVLTRKQLTEILGKMKA